MSQIYPTTTYDPERSGVHPVAPVRVLHHLSHEDHPAWSIPAVASDFYPLQAAAMLHRSVDHETICREAEALTPGEILEIRSDHDIGPLLERIGRHCTALVSRGETRVGPPEWVVRLTRRDPAAASCERREERPGRAARCLSALPVEFDLRGTGGDGTAALDRVLDLAASLEAGGSLVTRSRRPLPIYTLLAVWGFRQETGREEDGTWVATFTRPARAVAVCAETPIRQPLHGTHRPVAVASRA